MGSLAGNMPSVHHTLSLEGNQIIWRPNSDDYKVLQSLLGYKTGSELAYPSLICVRNWSSVIVKLKINRLIPQLLQLINNIYCVPTRLGFNQLIE